MRSITPEIQSYFDELYSRIGEGEHVPFEAVSLPGWEPPLAECHKNVDHWVDYRNAQPQRRKLKAVRGWLTWGVDAFGYCNLIAHSVVDEDGKLYDITPIAPDTPPLLFLRHVGTKKSFDEMQPEWSQTSYPLITSLSDEAAGIRDEAEQ
jgi:hypothetical protein